MVSNLPASLGASPRALPETLPRYAPWINANERGGCGSDAVVAADDALPRRTLVDLSPNVGLRVGRSAITRNVDFTGYESERWWGNPEIPTTVHRLVHPTRPWLFVKEAPSLRGEYERLLWCQGRLPVPEVVDFEQSADGDRLVTTAIDGCAAHDRGALPNKTEVAGVLAAAWRTVHEVEADECPFDSTPTSLLHEVCDRLVGNEDMPIWDGERRSQRSASDVYEELVDSIPPDEAPILVHGDASVPNVIVRDGQLAGIVDVGLLGRGDRWWDLSACLGSMSREDNDLGSERDTFMSSYGVAPDLERERWNRLLYRLVFDLPTGRARE